MPLSVRVEAGIPCRAEGFAEGGGDDRAGDPAVCGHEQGVAGAVVEPGDDLDVGAVGRESVVGEVGLPGLVRHGCFEPDVGGLRALLRLGGHEPGAGQVTADGGAGDQVPWWCSRCQAMVSGPASRPAWPAWCGAEDQFDDAGSRAAVRSWVVVIVVRRRPRPRRCSGPSAWRPSPWRRRRCCATSAWVRPSTMTAVMTSLAFDMTEHRTHELGFLCRETSVADVLNQHTAPATTKVAPDLRKRISGATCFLESFRPVSRFAPRKLT